MFDLFSRGLPDKPPFSSLLIFFKLSLLKTVEFEIISAAILYLRSVSHILSTLLTSISGEIFTAIGILLINFARYRI